MIRSQRIGFRRRWALGLFAQLRKAKVAEHRLDTLFWECTLRCNLACAHCGSDCRTQASVEDMPAVDFLKVLDGLTPHVDPHHVFVIFSGGEPLVRRDLETVGRAVYDRGYPWGLVSNGLQMTAERFEGLLKAGLHSLTISLDGLEPYHNRVRGNPQSWQKAAEAIRRAAAEQSILFDVVTCVSGGNIQELEALKELLIEWGVGSWRIFTIFPVGRAAENPELRVTDDQLTEVLDFVERTRQEGRIALSYACEGFLGGYEGRVRKGFYECRAGVSVASVRVDGAISGCTSVRGRYEQGNIYQDDFWTVWQHKFKQFRDRGWAKTGACADCKVFEFCQGGGMHLRGDQGELLLCHYGRLKK